LDVFGMSLWTIVVFILPVTVTEFLVATVAFHG
jgi:hypothetical protein